MQYTITDHNQKEIKVSGEVFDAFAVMQQKYVDLKDSTILIKTVEDSIKLYKFRLTGDSYYDITGKISIKTLEELIEGRYARNHS